MMNDKKMHSRDSGICTSEVLMSRAAAMNGSRWCRAAATGLPARGLPPGLLLALERIPEERRMLGCGWDAGECGALFVGPSTASCPGESTAAM